MELVTIDTRLVLKHEDDEGGRAVERSEIHGNAVGVQKVGLSHVFGGVTVELVARGSEAMTEGIDDSAEDQTVDQEHFYP